MSQLTSMLFVEGRGDGGLPSLTGISIFPTFLREMLQIMDRGIVLNMVRSCLNLYIYYYLLLLIIIIK